jgi:hypothetical protein
MRPFRLPRWAKSRLQQGPLLLYLLGEWKVLRFGELRRLVPAAQQENVNSTVA